MIAAAARLAAGLFAALLVGGPAQALDPTRHIDQYHHTGWTYRDGVPPAIRAIAQTPDGFLWLGSTGGLFRFDGVRAEAFGAEQLRGDTVTSLATSAEGNLWVGLSAGRLARVRGERIETFDLPAPLQGSFIEYLAADRGGVVWVGTQNEVLRFDGRRWSQVRGAWPPGATYADTGGVWALALGRDGTLWAKNVVGTYFLRRGAAAFEPAPGYGGGVIGFARAPDGRIWTSDFGVRRFYALPDVGAAAPPPRQFGAAVPPGAIGSAIYFDRDGALWLANRISFNLYRLGSATRPAELEEFTVPQGLTDRITSDVFEDREGDIWASTERGLDRFRAADIALERDVPVRNQSPALVATADAVYVYTGMPPTHAARGDGGRLYRLRPGRPPELLSPNIGVVLDMKATPNGDLLLAIDGKLKLWRNGALAPVVAPAEIEGSHVKNLAAVGDDLWISIFGRGVWRRHAGRWTRVALPASAFGGTPWVEADASGAVWLIYDDGRIIQLRGNRATVFAGAARPNIGAFQAFVADRAGPIFAGDLGVARFDGRAFRVIPATRAPALSKAAAIVETGRDVWFVSRVGVARTARQELLDAFANPTARPNVQLFDVQDGFTGIQGVDFDVAAARGPDGRVWFFTVDGLSWMDPGRLYHNGLPPPVMIRSLVAGGRAYPAPADLRLPKGTSRLEIDYTANSLQIPERVRFRYRLDGVDRDWVDAGGRRQAFYTNLGAGTYRFRVIAANNDGVWNTRGATLQFRILPTFWQTWAFKALVGAAALLALWLLYRLRMRQVSAQLRARIEARLGERERIARELHDTLLQSVQGLTLKLQAFAEQMPAKAPARRLMEQALDRADEVLAEGRDRVRNLRATRTRGDLADMLAAAIDRLRFDPTVEANLQVEGGPRPLHPVVLDEVMGFANEALFNAFTHAHAEHVTVEVRYERSELVVRVQDDGVGIDPAVLARGGREGHFGLAGMRERAGRIRGQLLIDSRPGAGADLVLSVPATIAYSRPGGLWLPFAPRRLEVED